MNKSILAIVSVLVVVIGVIVAVPIVNSSNWRNDTVNDVAAMFDVVTPNLEASAEFAGLIEPSPQQYDEEIERINTNLQTINSTIASIDDLGVNTLDITGAYEEADQLKNDFSTALNSLKLSSEQEVAILAQLKANGQTAELSDSYGATLTEVAVDYAELEQLVERL